MVLTVCAVSYITKVLRHQQSQQTDSQLGSDHEVTYVKYEYIKETMMKSTSISIRNAQKFIWKT
jgi:hypothetical protein